MVFFAPDTMIICLGSFPTPLTSRTSQSKNILCSSLLSICYVVERGSAELPRVAAKKKNIVDIR